jgi:hypothetical protein
MSGELTNSEAVWPLRTEKLMEDWAIWLVKEYPKRLGGWKILYCCPPRIWWALTI